MRITHQILNQTALDGMQTNLQRLSKVQKQAVTSKRVNLPEDDPFAVEQSLGFRRRLEASETTRKNIGLSLDWLNATDKALDDMSSLLSRARMLAVKGANGTLGPDERSAVAIEVDGLLEQAVGIGNTRHGDHYLFSGFQVDTSTFDVTRDVTTNFITGTTYNGDTGLINREVEPGTDMAINVLGDPLFSDAFDTLVGLRDALQATPFSVSDVTSALDDIKTNLDNVLNTQAAIGTKMSRLESTSQRMEDSEAGFVELLSKAEDADMAEVISQLNQQGFVYQTALNVNGQVLKMSLLDFLR